MGRSKRLKRPNVGDAQRLLEFFELEAVLIFSVDSRGCLHTATAGANVAKGKAIGWWANGLWGWAKVVSLVPFQTIFGWGNDGKPKPLSPRDAETVCARFPDAAHFLTPETAAAAGPDVLPNWEGADT